MNKKSRRRLFAGLAVTGIITLSVGLFLPAMARSGSGGTEHHTAAQAFKGNWSLSAATFKGSSQETLGGTNNAQVRLIWLPRKGWLPEGGFNLYRSEAGGGETPTRLNPQPIKPQNLLDPAKLPVLNGTQAAGVAATANVREAFAAITVKPSGATFGQMASEAQALQSLPGLSPSAIRTRLSQGAAAKNHVQSLRQSGIGKIQARTGNTGSGTPTAPATTPAEDTILLRGQIVLHALGNWQIATEAALAFADTTAQTGHRYNYTLKGIDSSGQEQTAPLAAVEFAVGSDALPPTPAPMALQADQSIADVHWDPPTNTQMDALLFAGYHIWRVDSAHPGGQKLNTNPIVLTYQEATDGSLLQALTSYRDSSAPQGNVTYRVTLVDAFGRESVPGTFALTMKDLRVPAPVPGVRALLNADQKTVSVYWHVSPRDTGDTNPVAYTLYRRDSEIALPTAPQRLSAPLQYLDTSTSASLDQMPLSVAIDLLGEAVLRAQLPELPAANDTKALGSWRASWGNKTVAELRTAGKLSPELTSALKKIQVATDQTASPDHYLVYGVSAAYTTNRRETMPIETTSLPVPDLTTPPNPGGFAAVFTRQAASFGGYDFVAKKLQYESNTLTRIAPPPLAVSQVYNAQGQLVPVQPANSQPRGRAAEQGGSIHVSWQAIPGNRVLYRVYRVVATGMFPANAGTGVIGQIQNLKALGKVGGKIPMSYYLDYPSADKRKPTLLTVTSSTSYDDPLPRSHGMNYLYRVQAVTRWGKESANANFQKVYIPATLPPSVPQVLNLYTTADGQVQIVVKPALVEEQVTEYRVFRNSAMPDQVQIAQVPQSAQVALGNRVAGAPPNSLAITKPRTQIVAKIGGQSLNPSNALGSAGARFGIKRYTSPSALLGRSLHLNGAAASSSKVKAAVAASGVATLPPSAIAKMLDIALTTELKNGTDIVQGTTTAGLTFTDTTGQPGQDYLYRVIAIGRDQVASGLSLPLDGKPIKTKANPVQNLAAHMANLTDPVSHQAQMVSSLSWAAPIGGAGSYIIERTLVVAGVADGDLPYQPLTTFDSTIGAPATLYHDTLARAGRTYRYRITATDDEGFVSAPVTVDLTVPIPGTAGPSPAVIASRLLVSNSANGPITAPAGTAPLTTTSGNAGGGLASPQPATRTAHFHQAYQLTSAGRFAVRVDAASYTTNAYAIDAQNYYYCRPAEKFLKLRLRVRNVSSQPEPFDYQTITASCVEADGSMGAETKNWKALDTSTLANRTVASSAELIVEGVVTTNAMGSPQSISFGDCAFDLSDPANAIPALDAPSESPASQGTLYPLAFTTGGITAAAQAAMGYKVTLTVKNTTLGSLTVGPEVYIVTVFDEDGDKYTAKSTAGKTTLTALTAGGTTTIDYTFEVPRTIHIRKITFHEKDSRVYVITQGGN